MASDVIHSTEAAFKSFIALSITSATIYAAHTDTEMKLPAIICEATAGDEVVMDTGIHKMRVVLTVRTSADITAHTDLCQSLDDLLRWDTLATDLSTQPNFHCYDCTFTGSTGSQVDDQLVTTIEIEAVCCAQNIS